MLALTIGLLLFLFIDTLGEGLELATEVLGRLRGTTAVWISMGLTAVALLAIGRRGGKAPEGVRLAFFIALGIGLHNLGEGLVVGAALATGAAALASFLVVGFVVHNVTEGIGIAAPLAAGKRPPIAVFFGLAAVAGLPAMVGVLLGTSAVNPYWAALSFGVGAGAILQVIIEVAAFMTREGGKARLLEPAGAAGIVTGLVVMYATALLV
jgi:zinc transporter ZupT